MKLSRSLIAYIVCCLVLAVASFWFYPKWQKGGSEATISWDVFGYYLYLPATFIHQDLKKVAFLEQVIEDYKSVPNTEQAVFPHPSGNRVMKYSLGQAVSMSPFFFASHLYALNSSAPADGYSRPYQFGIQLGSLCVAFLGLWVMRKLLLRWFTESAVAVSLLLLVLATNYLEYAGITNAMTHNYLFTIYALLMLVSIRFYERPSWGMALAIGVLTGLAALTRPTEIIAALIPLLWGVSSFSGLRERGSLIYQHWGKYLLAVVACGFVGSWQLLYWKYVGDAWIIYSYQDQGFSWFSPHFADALFSYRAGWLVYSPIMSLAVLGFVPLYRQSFPSFWGLLLFAAIFTYIACAWDIWWYGGSLGQRAMVQLYPVLLFSMAAMLMWLFRQRAIWSILLGLFAVLCIYLNFWMHYQAHGGGLFRAGRMTKAYYLRVVGTFEQNKEDLKLLDAKEDFTGERKNVRTIYTNDFEQDSTAIDSPHRILQGTRSLWLDENREHSPVYAVPIGDYPEGTWVRASINIYCPHRSGESWRMPHFSIFVKENGGTIKKQYIKPFRLMQSGEQRVVYMDTRLPGAGEADRVDLVFWRGYGGQVMVMDELTVELFEE